MLKKGTKRREHKKETLSKPLTFKLGTMPQDVLQVVAATPWTEPLLATKTTETACILGLGLSYRSPGNKLIRGPCCLRD